ncbi:hypothetical protein CsatA_013230 [Cannabis sativa]
MASFDWVLANLLALTFYFRVFYFWSQMMFDFWSRLVGFCKIDGKLLLFFFFSGNWSRLYK